MLTEERRTQLDGIVQTMVTNKEPDDNIQFVVDDFKKKYEGEQTPQPQVQNTENPLVGFGKGLGKGALSTIEGLEDLGEKTIGKAANYITSKITGTEVKPQTVDLIPEQLREANTPSQKVGKGVEQVAEFFIPGGVATKTAKITEGAGKLAKITSGVVKEIPEAVKAASISSAQEGSADDFFKNAIIYGSLSKVGQSLGKVKDVVTKQLPSKLVNTAIKPSLEESRKAIKYGGETLGEELIKRGIAGSDNKILETSIEKMNIAEDSLQSIIKQSSEKINRTELQAYLKSLIKEKKETPGLLDEVKKINEVVKQLPKEMTLSQANKVKRNLYNALRDVAFKIDPSLSTKKEAMKAIAKGIKTEIEKKVGGETIKNLNKDLSVFGRLHDRITDKLARAERNNLVSFGDVPFAVGGALAGLTGEGDFQGSIKGLVAGILARRVGGSTTFKTNSAKILTKLGEKLDSSIADKAGKISKTAIYKAIEEAFSD